MGRGKVVLKRIENPSSRQVTFSKRRNGLLKKAFELSILCDAEVALLIFSSSGKLFQFASHDMERTVAKYRNEVGLPTSDNRPESSTIEFWRNETLRLTRSIDDLEAKLNHIAGENLSSLGMKELRQLERQLKTGVERIRSKKRRLISEHINMLKRNHKTLQEENLRLQKRVKLNEVDDGNTSSMMFSADDDACEYPYQRTFLDGC